MGEALKFAFADISRVKKYRVKLCNLQQFGAFCAKHQHFQWLQGESSRRFIEWTWGKGLWGCKTI